MFEELYEIMDWPFIEGIEYSDIDNPHDILGPHDTADGMLIQTYQPGADSVKIKIGTKLYDMCRMDEAGFFAYITKNHKKPAYRLVVNRDGNESDFFDPYSFDLGTSYQDIRKLNAGVFYDAYKYMGAHVETINRVKGVMFRVWAPEAMRVSVVGEFNNWDGRVHQMSRLGETGVFEIFIPGVKANALYKYEIKKKGGENILKADPYAFRMESVADGASIVVNDDEFKWTDEKWIADREKFDASKNPISIYQVNISNYVEDDKVDYVKAAKVVAEHAVNNGYTHVDVMPVTEYPENENGYKTSFFYAPTSAYGDRDGLKKFVDILHEKGVGVIIDWTPDGFNPDDNGLTSYDGTCLYEHSNPKRGFNYKNNKKLFNYGRAEVTSYLLGSAFMWIDDFHFDGVKIANTAAMLYLDYDKKLGEWEPNIYGGNENLEAIEFIKHFNSILHKDYQGIITIADDNSGFPELTGEVSESCLGFDFVLNYNWREDFIGYMKNPPYLRGKHYNDLSLSMVYQYSENYIVGYPNNDFMGQPSLFTILPGDTEDKKYANTKLALAYSYVHPGKKIIFQGQDAATADVWTLNAAINKSVSDNEKNVLAMVEALNKLYKESPALYELDNDVDGFEWINNISAQESILTFIRKGTKKEDTLIVVCNFEDIDQTKYKIGVPFVGKYKEIFSTDDVKFGGNGNNNPRLKQSKTDECDGREESIRINVPALSVNIFSFTEVKVVKKVVDNKTAKENAKKEETVKNAEPVKAIATKKTETKAIATKKAETKAIATKKAETKAIATKKAETKAIATKKTETKAIATKKTETKAIEEKKAKPAKKTAAKKTTTKKATAKKDTKK